MINSARHTFEQNMIQLANAKALQSEFSTLFEKCSLLAGDDMTAIIVRA